MNFALQPILLVEGLRKLGVDAHHLQYMGAGGKHRFDFRMDKVYYYDPHKSLFESQMQALKEVLHDDYDIYHFWQRSLIFRPDCSDMTGLDLPLIKARGESKIIHRFTGYDLRLKSWDKAVNPYSAFNYKFDGFFDENTQKEYISFLREYVDLFLVQDPELKQFMPEAEILPRALDLDEWQYVGIEKTDCPLVVHAPTNKSCKGSEFVFKAIEVLKDEGLKFNFQTIQNMSHDKAREMYRKADIIIDQLLIGATGVLTLEGWALGKPVVVYLREDLFKPFYGEVPAANANPDTITNVLRDLIKDHDWRQELSQKGRKTVEKFHDSKIVSQKCLDIYNNLEKKKGKTPKGTADIDYILKVSKPNNSLKNLAYSAIRKFIPGQLLYSIKSFVDEPSFKNISAMTKLGLIFVAYLVKGTWKRFLHRIKTPKGLFTFSAITILTICGITFLSINPLLAISIGVICFFPFLFKTKKEKI